MNGFICGTLFKLRLWIFFKPFQANEEAAAGGAL